MSSNPVEGHNHVIAHRADENITLFSADDGCLPTFTYWAAWADAGMISTPINRKGHTHSSPPSHVEKTTTALERLPACLIGCGAVDRPEPGA